MLKKLFVKYKDIISYLFFGVCTTVVNIVAYWACAHIAHLSTVVSTSIAWVVAVAFAYITNRLWVFHSKAKGKKAILREICAFTACRLLTGFLDVAIMYIFVDRLHCPDLVIKIISNIIVIIANYIASKLVIFSEKDKAPLYKKVLVVATLLFVGFILAQHSSYGVMRHGDGTLDSPVYRYVGQVVRDGGMPYRDVFDHKGPLLYVLYALTGYIDDYRGSWLLELSAIMVSIFAFYIAARRLKCRRVPAILATVTIMTICATYFYNGCCCLYSMPFIAVSICIFINYLSKKPIKNLSIWLCGLCCGSVLMIRPNLISLWAIFGIAVLIDFIKQKKYKELVRFALLFLAGILTVVAPLMIWLIANGAFSDFWLVYIEFNFFYSAGSGGLIRKTLGMLYIMEPIITGFAFFYLVWRLVTYRTRADICFSIFFISTIITGGFSGREYGHYLMSAVPALIYPYATLFSHMPEVSNKKRMNTTNAAIVIAAMALLLMTVYPSWRIIIRENVNVFVKRNEMDYKNSATMRSIAAVVKKYTNPDDKIVVYGHHVVFYSLSERRSFTKYPYALKDILGFKNNRDEYFAALNDGKPKIIIVESGYPETFEDIRAFLKKNQYEAVYPNSTYDIDDFDPAIKDQYAVFYRSVDNK